MEVEGAYTNGQSLAKSVAISKFIVKASLVHSIMYLEVGFVFLSHRGYNAHLMNLLLVRLYSAITLYNVI